MNHLSRRCNRGGDGRGRGQRRPDEVARDAHGVAARRRENELHLDRVAVDVGPLEGPRVDERAPLPQIGRDGDGVGRGGVSPLLLIEPCLHDSQEQIFAFPIIQRETTKMSRVFDETNADFASEQDDWHLTTAIAFWWQPQTPPQRKPRKPRASLAFFFASHAQNYKHLESLAVVRH